MVWEALTGVVFSDFQRVLGTGGRVAERVGFLWGRDSVGVLRGVEVGFGQSGRSRGVWLIPSVFHP